MSRKPSAKEQRFTALQELSRACIRSDGALEPGIDPDHVLTAIEALRPLGRTDRWQRALTRWQDLVKEYPDDLHYAIVQGGMYGLWAA